MLSVPADYPHPGCTAFLAGTAEAVRLIQRNADGSCLVQRTGPVSRSEGASIERRVPFADLFENALAALGKSKPRRRAA